MPYVLIIFFKQTNKQKMMKSMCSLLGGRAFTLFCYNIQLNCSWLDENHTWWLIWQKLDDDQSWPSKLFQRSRRESYALEQEIACKVILPSTLVSVARPSLNNVAIALSTGISTCMRLNQQSLKACIHRQPWLQSLHIVKVPVKRLWFLPLL